MIPFIYCNITSHSKLRDVKCQPFHYALIFCGLGIKTASQKKLSLFHVWGCTWEDLDGGGDTLLRLEPLESFFTYKSGSWAGLTRRLHWNCQPGTYTCSLHAAQGFPSTAAAVRAVFWGGASREQAFQQSPQKLYVSYDLTLKVT